jgi:hypothetical protein
MSPPRATHVTPQSVVRRASQSDLLIDNGKNIMDQLENRWPFSDTCISQSVDTEKGDRLARERPRREGVDKKSAGIDRS